MRTKKMMQIEKVRRQLFEAVIELDRLDESVLVTDFDDDFNDLINDIAKEKKLSEEEVARLHERAEDAVWIIALNLRQFKQPDIVECDPNKATTEDNGLNLFSESFSDLPF